jgi:hypothetical protein
MFVFEVYPERSRSDAEGSGDWNRGGYQLPDPSSLRSSG